MHLHERLGLNRDDLTPGIDPFSAIKTRVHQSVITALGPQLSGRDVDPATLRTRVENAVRAELDTEMGLSREDRERLIKEVADEALGHGPLEKLLGDESVTEIMVNGPFDVWVEREGRLSATPIRFADEAHLRRVISKIVSQVGRRVDESSPMVDARLPDGSRVNAVVPPLSLTGSLLTIRKFAQRRLDLDHLVTIGTFSAAAVEFLRRCVRAELNVLIVGGTGSGKTTLLNALSSAIPDDCRIVTIEDAAELQLHQRHVLRLESRPRNVEGEGEISIRDLLRNSLRMRPDRIIVGECRGAEALDMLQAMNTGHDGSMSTLHANSPRDALARLETLVLMAGYELPLRAIRQQIASAVDMIVQIGRLQDGTRRVTHITEVQRMEADVITLQDVYTFKFESIDLTGRVHGALRATGLRPQCSERFAKYGIDMPAGMFAPGATAMPVSGVGGLTGGATLAPRKGLRQG